MAKPHMPKKKNLYSLYVRRSGKFSWKLADDYIRRPLPSVVRMGIAYLEDKYHGHGQFYVYDKISDKAVFSQTCKPKMLCLQPPKPHVDVKRPFPNKNPKRVWSKH